MRRSLSTLVAGALLVAACAGATDAGDSAAPTKSQPPAPETTVVRDYPDAIQRRLWRMASEPRPVESSAMPPRHLDEEQFPEVLVQRDRIVSGGLLQDQIPAIDDPRFAPAQEIDWLGGDEAVLVLQLDETVRAYPVQVLMWHEIVNDVVDGVTSSRRTRRRAGGRRASRTGHPRRHVLVRLVDVSARDGARGMSAPAQRVAEPCPLR